MDESNPEWVPTLNLGYENIGAVALNEEILAQSRYSRAKKKRESKAQSSYESLHSLDQDFWEGDSKVMKKELEHGAMSIDYCILASDNKCQSETRK